MHYMLGKVQPSRLTKKHVLVSCHMHVKEYLEAYES